MANDALIWSGGPRLSLTVLRDATDPGAVIFDWGAEYSEKVSAEQLRSFVRALQGWLWGDLLSRSPAIEKLMGDLLSRSLAIEKLIAAARAAARDVGTWREEDATIDELRKALADVDAEAVRK